MISSFVSVNNALFRLFSKPAIPAIRKVQGFYGLIGPDVDASKTESLYDLFTGDGVIQGAFFDDGKITFVKHYIRTEKVEFEKTHGASPKHYLWTVFKMLLTNLGIIPNMMGSANTALMKTEKGLYALFERDHPYLLDLDFSKKTIATIKKLPIKGLHSFSAHSKTSACGTIETIDYHILNKRIVFKQLDQDFNALNTLEINTEYMPLVHDFLYNTQQDQVILLDSPFIMKPSLTNIPVKFDSNKPTFLRVFSETQSWKYRFDQGFYIFHYGDLRENTTHIEIYAPIYEQLDFSKIDIIGKYRKLVVDKTTNETSIVKSDYLELFNLDFPVKWCNGNVILRNINSKTINGFVICKGLEIQDIMFFDNLAFCGEPAIIPCDGDVDYLTCFANDCSNGGTLVMVPLNKAASRFDRSQIIEVPLNQSLGLGFHSIYIPSDRA
jgi:carotenoid cleavage dioxygenase-like enzyme